MMRIGKSIRHISYLSCLDIYTAAASLNTSCMLTISGYDNTNIVCIKSMGKLQPGLN